MPNTECRRHKGQHPCTCAMGHLYRFVEPVLLLILKEKKQSYGYDLSGELSRYSFTDSEIENAVLYRTLRRLEAHGYVISHWDVDNRGPASESLLADKRGTQASAGVGASPGKSGQLNVSICASGWFGDQNA